MAVTMYRSHPALSEPQDDATLWRYVSIEKFLYVLEQRALFFARLASLHDAFEGHPPRSTVEHMTHISLAAPNDALVQSVQSSMKALVSGSKKMLCVSCWHMNDRESDAMWERYSAGLCIQTTFGRLKESFGGAGREVNGGIVEYVDHEIDNLVSSNVIRWATYKRKVYSHDQEFRAIVMGPPTDDSGVTVTAALESLIAGVCVSPSSPAWVADVIDRLLRRYGLSGAVSRSSISAQPSY